MERSQRPYSLFKRHAIRSRHIYYCRFRGQDGRYLAPVSNGLTSKAAVANWADQEITNGHRIPVGAMLVDLSEHQIDTSTEVFEEGSS